MGGAGGTVDFNTANQQIVLESTTINTSGGAGDGDTQGDGGTVTFAAGDPVFLSVAPTVITTGATFGDINFLGTVDGTQDLTLTAGTGNILFDGVVGAAPELADVVINAANNVTINQNFTAQSFDQAVQGTGTFTLGAGATLTATNGKVDIDSEDVDLEGTIINNAGGADGNVIIQAGADGVTLAAGESLSLIHI